MDNVENVEAGTLGRRGLVKAAAWAAPAVVMMGAAPTICLSKNPFEDCDGPYHIDQRAGGVVASGRMGNFHFIVPQGTAFPKMQWRVQLVPVKNSVGLVKKGKRGFEIRDLQWDNAGSNKTYSPARQGLDYDYNPSTGVQTATFTTPAWEDTGSSGGLNYGFNIFTGDTVSSWDPKLAYRWDKVVVQAVQIGPDGEVCGSLNKPLVNYDSVAVANNLGNGYAYDGIV